jgi:hypothetical protein
MIDVPLREYGEIVTVDAPADERLSNLAGFERVVKRAAELLA